MTDVQAIQLTAAAIAHVQRKIAEQGHGHGLRVALKKRGCSGLAYDLKIVDSAAGDENVFVQPQGIFVCVPAKDLPFVSGTQIDYVKHGLGAQFEFNNPHEVASCGCGESFTVSSSEDVEH